MQLCHTPAALSAVFDEPNLIACAGLVPAVALADRIGLRDLAEEWLTVPGSGGTAGAKVMSLVAGMLAGADSIDDLDLLRHGGMDKVFTGMRAPSTLGVFLRGFTFGHVRQLDAVASRALIGLADVVPGIVAGADGTVMLDVDDTVKPVFGAAKQGAQHGYTRVKGLNAQLATISTDQAAPVIVATRLRRGAAASAHGAVRLVRDGLTTARRAGVTGQILVRADSAYYQHAFVTAITKAGACFSVGARQDSAVRRAIASIDDRSWVRIEYPQAMIDPDTGELVSCAEVAEVPYLAFTSHGSKAVPGRLIVRRVPERNTTKLADAAQEGLFTVWRYHAIFTNNPAPLVVAESQHRGHAIVEQVIADLKAGPLAHLPSGRFQANAAWLVAATIAFNLTRAIGVAAGGKFTRAEAATVRARVLNVPARVSRSGRRQRLHLPQRWPWASQWQTLWTTVMTT
jgi:Transposase DDE domain group 1